MKQFLIQYRKDFQAHFNNFNAYIIIGGYYILSFFFTLYFGDYFLRESEIINAYLATQPIILMLVLPAVTMRSWADEFKSGTIELLLTQPISYVKLVLAKFFSAFSFFLFLVLSSLPFLYITNLLSVLDFGATFSGYLGVILCGALYTAVGCLVSWFNRNNILSYISTILVIFFISQFRFDSITLLGNVISLNCLNFNDNFAAFLSGVLYVCNIIYFVLGTILCLWLNTVAIDYKKTINRIEKKLFFLFTFLLFLIFCFGTLATDLLFNHAFDVTDNHKFTLTKQSSDFLSQTDKRIDITLYEAKSKREEASSNYAVYAEFIERFLKMIEKSSKGAVRSQIIHVEPFSAQETALIKQKIPYQEDSYDNKIFMTADFSDNDGHSGSINAFSALRQNLLEADIMRAIHRFGIDKKNILLVASTSLQTQISAFQAMLHEFYNVTTIDKVTHFISPIYDAAIVFMSDDYSTEEFLALEQYILNGGNLIIFDEAKRPHAQNMQGFLLNFGIKAFNGKHLTFEVENHTLEIGPSYPSDNPKWQGIRSVLVNGVGQTEPFKGDGYIAQPLLTFNGKNIAIISSGRFVSNYINFASEAMNILPVSHKDGKLLFFYDTDIFKDYLYVSSETKGNGFYEIISQADNLLFGLQLLDYVLDESVEQQLNYRHYAINKSSIGHLLLDYTQKRYESQTQELKLKLEDYTQKKKDVKNLLSHQAFISVRDIGDIGSLAQNIEEIENALGKIRLRISQDYQLIILVLTGIIIFVIPCILLVLLASVLIIIKKIKNKKIEEFIANVTTN